MRERYSLERNSSHELHVPRLRHCAVPGSKARTGGIVVKGDAIAERLAVTRKVVIVEDVEGLCANFEGESLLDDDLLGYRDVGVAIRRTAYAADPWARAQIIPTGKHRSRFEGRHIVRGLVHIHIAPRLRQDL